VDSIALYYPHIHVRDDTWLKYAALYWPKMGRLRPPEYPLMDSEVAARLHEARWLVDIPPPRWAAAELVEPFLSLVTTHARELRERFGLDQVDTWGVRPAAAAFGYSGDRRSAGNPNGEVTWLNPRFGFVHVSKIDPDVVSAAVDAGLAVTGPGRGGMWVGMHPELASVYTCALTERVAAKDLLHPITDQTLPHNALSGWTLDRLVGMLVERPAAGTGEHRPDVLDAFVFLAFETVVPADLRTVSVEKILDVRAKFATELDAFRGYVAQQVHSLAELDDVRDLVVFQEYLRTEVHRSVTALLNDLRERLRSVGLEAVRAVANVKSVALPPLAAVAADTAGLPPAVTVPAAVAACVAGAPIQWRRDRRAAIQESPVAYLFQLKRTLDPTTLLDRLRRAWPA
jgi:uncharacterized protein DUF6236